jgi:hypothetical protein
VNERAELLQVKLVMSTSKPSPSDEESSREELVAYLDGELAPQDSSRVEKLLADDPKYRDEMVGLEKVWGALDSIPRSTVDESFTSTTVEMVAVAAEKEVDHQRETLPLQTIARSFAVVCIVLLMGLIGYLSARLFRPDSSVRLERDLPVIEHIDAYLVHEGDDPTTVSEFVKSLKENDLFSSEGAENVGN